MVCSTGKRRNSGNAPPSLPHAADDTEKQTHQNKIQGRSTKYQTNEFEYLGGMSVTVHRGRPAHTQRRAQLPEVRPRTIRPTERSPRDQIPDAKSRGTRDDTAVRLRRVEPARVLLRHAAPSLPQLPHSLHRLSKEHSYQPLDFVSGHAYRDGK